LREILYSVFEIGDLDVCLPLSLRQLTDEFLVDLLKLVFRFLLFRLVNAYELFLLVLVHELLQFEFAVESLPLLLETRVVLIESLVPASFPL
jgi:hypothetical protein